MQVGCSVLDGCLIATIHFSMQIRFELFPTNHCTKRAAANVIVYVSMDRDAVAVLAWLPARQQEDRERGMRDLKLIQVAAPSQHHHLLTRQQDKLMMIHKQLSSLLNK